MKGKTIPRPARSDVAKRLLANLFLVFVLEELFLTLFQVRGIFPPGHDGFVARLLLTLELLPGLALAYTLFWYWLVLLGRVRDVSWGAAFFYGILIGIAGVVVAGGIAGLIAGNPILGVLLGIVALFMNPPILFAQGLVGLVLGLWMGFKAETWLEEKRSA